MRNKLLNIISALLSVITEIWVLKLFGVSDWSDIVAGVGMMFCVPIVVVPFGIFRFWLEYIFCENEKSTSTSQSTRNTSEGEDSNKHDTRETTSRKGEQFDAGQMFLYFVSAMAAKIAKADGHVDSCEVTAIDMAFKRLGLTELQRKFCIEIFQLSIKSSESVSSIALQLKAASFSNELKSILYEILWNVACADGILTQSEKNALKTISEILELNSYERFYHQRVKKEEQRTTGQHIKSDNRMTLNDAYEILGCRNSDANTIIKAAYREKAKKNHPDLLKSQGLPEEMIDLATKRMAIINAAWELIKKSRNI